MLKCINLKTEFPQYRVTSDEAACSEDKRDPWYFCIRGRLGTIYPWSESRLAVEVDHHPSAVRKLKGLGLLCTQHGDAEHTFLFNSEQFTMVADIVKPYRKRRVSEAQRQKLAERLEKARLARPSCSMDSL